MSEAAVQEPVKETILGTPPKEAAAPPAGDPGVADKGKEVPVAPVKPVVPEKYDLKLPEGSRLQPARLEKIQALAKEKGLSQEQAQLIVDRENDAVTDFHARSLEAYAAEEQKWMRAAQDDKEIGGENLKVASEHSKRVLDQFASEELKKELTESRLGNHPELVRLLYRIGKAMHPKGLVTPSNQGGATRGKTAEEVASRMYGGSSKQ